MGHNLFYLAQSLFVWAHKLCVKAEEAAIKDIQNLEIKINNLNLERYAHVELRAKASKFKNKLEEFLNV